MQTPQFRKESHSLGGRISIMRRVRLDFMDNKLIDVVVGTRYGTETSSDPIGYRSVMYLRDTEDYHQIGNPLMSAFHDTIPKLDQRKLDMYHEEMVKQATSFMESCFEADRRRLVVGTKA